MKRIPITHLNVNDLQEGLVVFEEFSLRLNKIKAVTIDTFVVLWQDGPEYTFSKKRLPAISLYVHST